MNSDLIAITVFPAVFALVFRITYFVKLRKIHKALDKNLYSPRHCFEEGFRIAERSILNQRERYYRRMSVTWKNITIFLSLIPLFLLICQLMF